jgi:hypothetical protein
MKSFFAIMLLLCVSISYTYAGEEYEKDENKQSTKMEDREVIYYDHDLELELEASNGTVYAEWDEFNLDEPKDFEWYKLVYSTSKTNPVYPDDEAVFIGKIDQTEAKFRLQK